MTRLVLVLGLLAGLGSAGSEAGAAEAKGAVVERNPVVFWELASHDAEASVEFFKAVFGWDLSYSERVKFFVMPPVEGSEGIGGGIFTLRKAKLPFLTLYIQVADIEAKARLVRDHGGYIIEEPQTLDSGSRICLFNEPSGVTFAMLQPAPKQD